MAVPFPRAPHPGLGPRGRWWFDVALATALLVPTVAYTWTGTPAAAVFSLLEVAPLYWRRAHPVPVFAVVAVASAAQVFVVDVPVWGQIAFPVATYSVARFAATRYAVPALVVGLAGAVVGSVTWLHGFGAEVESANLTPYLLTISAIVVTAWALGTLGRVRQAYVDGLVERGERIEREAAQAVELAASAERARIAREMHDVVAHGLSVIVVQADGARYAAARDPEVAVSTLATVSESARSALTEMRRLLGLLRSEGETGRDPQPRLADLDALVEQARSAGTPVVAELPDSDAPVPDGVGLTAYRVVQEALSNVRKHAGPQATARVRVAVTADDLAIEVADDGRGAATTAPEGGLGLLGMRERVAVHDGTLDAGPCPGGGFRVAARIPL